MKDKFNITDNYLDSDCSSVVADDGSHILKMNNKTGEGMMTFYNVFPGIFIIYSDFHMQMCKSYFKTNSNILCIDHCREGIIEQKMEENEAYSYFEAGDLKVDRRVYHQGNIEFPLHHFHGVSICFELDQAAKSISSAMQGYQVNLYDIQKKYCDNKYPFVIKKNPCIEHIFAELYAIPQKIKDVYLKIKILELLLYLDVLELADDCREKTYFYKNKVEQVKAIHNFITENINEHYTLEYLSKRFCISLTTMKDCFKHVYGNSIFAYMRIYRMNRAAVLLKKNKEMSIAEIAGVVGYDSPGKFGTAFKDVMGILPLTYRKNKI